MNFCTIAPGSMLESVETSHIHLILPQVTNLHYIKFYQKVRGKGDTLILDNGAYEGKFNERQLLRAITTYDPQYVVLPDALLKSHHITYQMAAAFALENKTLLSGRRLIYIPQAEAGDIMSATNAVYAAMVHAFEHGWDIGLPRAFATHMGCPSLRVEATKWLRKEKYNGYIHAFGMANGSLSELSSLSRAGANSCDSSCAVWRGYHGIDLCEKEGDEKWRSIGTPVDFDSPTLRYGDSRWEVIERNQRKIKEAMNG